MSSPIASTRFSPPTSSPSRTVLPRRSFSRLTSAAALWSLAYGLLGLSWALGGKGFPFGEGHDPDPDYSNLAALTQAVGGPVIAIWGVIGAVAVADLARSARRGWLSAVSVGLVMAEALTLILVVPDFRVLIRVAYAPVVLIGAPFGWPPGASVAEMVQWTVMNQFVCIIGGVLLLGTALVHHRRLSGACTSCGRRAGAEGWSAPRAAARWGRWAAWIAVGLPFVYSVTRWGWALGWPIGVTEEFLREEARETPFIWYAGAYLGTVGAAGGLLTLGLVQRWGEVFPRWMGPLAGKRVPPKVAIVPASVIALLIFETGLMYDRMALTGTWDEEFSSGNWGTVLPEMTWPLWGLSLGAATLAYHYRRRGVCLACGRGQMDTPAHRPDGNGWDLLPDPE